MNTGQEIAPLGQQLTEAPRATKEAEKIYDIQFKQLDHGYIVSVGCKNFAIESPAKLITLLSTYILQPNATEKLFYDGKLFSE